MKLHAKCLFPFLKMVKKMNIRPEIKSLFAAYKGQSEDELEQLQQEMGLEFFLLLSERLPDAEEELYAFMSAYTGKSAEELHEMELFDLIDIFKSIFVDERFADFFQRALK